MNLGLGSIADRDDGPHSRSTQIRSPDPPRAPGSATPPRGPRVLHGAARLGWLAAGLCVFVAALELLKAGGAGLGPLLRTLHVGGLAGGLGFGWVMACLVLSGSPVAAIALTLLASGALTAEESFAMIGGSRLGASFVVLLIGAADDVRAGRREGRSAYIGVVALLATAVTYLPALGLGLAGLRAGVLQGLRLEGRDLAGLTAGIAALVRSVATAAGPLVAFVAGIGVLLAAFRLLDRALPEIDRERNPLARFDRVLYRPWFTFVLGMAITTLTLSVSVSLSLLVPLASKGWVRRENVWPYVLGANVTTFVDTLFAGALVGHPDAVRLVALMMGSVALCSLPVVLLTPYAFGRALDRTARAITRDRRRLVAFVVLLLATPLVLIAVGRPV